jgi:hypothetical protein
VSPRDGAAGIIAASSAAEGVARISWPGTGVGMAASDGGRTAAICPVGIIESRPASCAAIGDEIEPGIGVAILAAANAPGGAKPGGTKAPDGANAASGGRARLRRSRRRNLVTAADQRRVDMDRQPRCRTVLGLRRTESTMIEDDRAASPAGSPTSLAACPSSRWVGSARAECRGAMAPTSHQEWE